MLAQRRVLMETSGDVELHLCRLSRKNFSSLLIKFPLNEGKKISNLVIASYLLRNNNLSLITKKLCSLHRAESCRKMKSRKNKQKTTAFLFSDAVGNEKRWIWPTPFKTRIIHYTRHMSETLAEEKSVKFIHAISH